MWIGEYRTYEQVNGEKRHVLTHIFTGETQLGMLANVKAHMLSDGFFNGCTNKGSYGPIKCWTEARIYERPSL